MAETDETCRRCCGLYFISSLINIWRQDRSCRRCMSTVAWVLENQPSNSSLSNSPVQIVVQLLMASCDSFSFHLLFSALSRSSLDHTVVDLLCSKPIVPDSRTTSLEFISLLGKLIQNREAASAKILLEKGSHVSIFSFEPHLYWPESPTEEEKCCLIGV
jgi:hypothetical protein